MSALPSKADIGPREADVPESAVAADVSMALRSRGWSPYALRLDPEQHAWIALVMDWRRAA